ncbi:PAS domain S-box protein, partial [bacterium]|nr:PAS domain S-box protein [bacterium]
MASRDQRYMPSQAFTLLEKITGWRLNVVFIILTIGLTDLVVAVVDWLLLGRIGPDSMMVSTVSGLIIATLVVSAAGSLRARIAKAHRRNLEQGIKRAQSHLRLTIETSGMLVWELDLLTAQMQYDHANLSFLGLATDTKADNISDWLALVHPDDRASFQRRFQETLIPGAPAFKLDYRLQQATGDWQWVNTQGQVTVRDAQGAPLVAVGGTINIDQRKQTELALQESKERLEAIFNENPELMLISRLSDGHITEVNEAFIRRAGFSREQAIGNTTLGLGLWVHTQDRQRMTDALFAKGRCNDLETVFYDHTGQVVECALDAVATNVGGVPHIVCTVRDISQRKRAEAERQASETLLRTTLASTDEGILMVGQDGQVLSANQRFVELWRVPEELIATGRDDVMMAHVLGQLRDPDAFVSLVQRLYSSDAQARDTLHFKDGRVFARFTRALAFGDQRGRIWCFKDVTDESRTQAELAVSLNLFRAVIDNAPLRIFWKDQDLRYSGCNPIFAKDAGLSSEDDLIGKSDAEMSWHDHADAYNADDLAVMNSGVTKLAYEEKQTTPDGQIIWLRTSKVPLHNVDNQLIGVMGMYEDVTQAKLAASALAFSEEKFRKAFVLIPDAMNINRLSDGMYVSVNEGFTKLMGYASEEIVGHTSLEFDIWQHPEDRARLVEALKQNGSISSFETGFRDKAGGIHFASMSAAVIDIDGQAHIISISRDMTERKKIEAALEAERERFQTILRNASDGVTVMNS